MKGSLLLLPNIIGDNYREELPSSVDQAVENIDGLIAESPQKGRSFLKRFKLKKKPHELPLALFNEHSKDNEIDFLLEPMLEGETWGMISDAGLPCVADPGNKLVYRAHQLNISVVPYVGPSSIMMALMISGLSGQRFCFNGYLSKKPEERKKQISDLKKHRSTQIIMEAPYRNDYLLKDLLESLSNNTKLCVVWDIMLPTHGVITQKIKDWKKITLPDLRKKMALFLFEVI